MTKVGEGGEDGGDGGDVLLVRREGEMEGTKMRTDGLDEGGERMLIESESVDPDIVDDS